MKKTVFVGMSGGVDSSVSATLLKEQGFTVVGVHLRCWNIDGCADQDAEDARRAAETLGIPFYVFDFEEEYKKKVVDYMVQGYKKGITPNPDVMCNAEIKFGLFFKKAMKLGADYIATGHYADIKNNKIFISKDKNKDQTYFLWTLTKDKIKKTIFPLGNITKPQVRKIARKYNLPNAEKKDSQGVCFLGHIDLPEFLDRFIDSQIGDILDMKGKKLGTHQGAHKFTVGQRRGLGVGGFKDPKYVVKKDVKNNIVVLADEDDESLYSKGLEIEDINYIQGKEVRGEIFLRIRYRQTLFPAKIKKNVITFKKPQKFIALGQSAVFYSKDKEMLGGGVISKLV